MSLRTREKARPFSTHLPKRGSSEVRCFANLFDLNRYSHESDNMHSLISMADPFFFLSGYVETKVIPVGARNIRVEEVASSPNYLALRSSSGKWYLNGDWYIQQSGEYSAAGTTVSYKRRHNKEIFEALGPTTDEIHIMVKWTSMKVDKGENTTGSRKQILRFDS